MLLVANHVPGALWGMNILTRVQEPTAENLDSTNDMAPEAPLSAVWLCHSRRLLLSAYVFVMVRVRYIGCSNIHVVAWVGLLS